MKTLHSSYLGYYYYSTTKDMALLKKSITVKLSRSYQKYPFQLAENFRYSAVFKSQVDKTLTL